jgi:small GTP-binding protein
MKREPYDYLTKILLIGESGVGKTSLLQTFTKNSFPVNHLPTIAIDFKVHTFEINGSKVRMQLWDTAGQERFNTLTGGFFKGRLSRRERDNRGLLGRRCRQLQCRE